MIVASLNTGSAGTSQIGLTEVLSTNSNAEIVNSNSIQIKQPGFYEIQGTACLTSSSGANTGVYVSVNGTQYGANCQYLAAAASEVQTVPIYAVVEVKEGPSGSYATVAVNPIGSPTVTNGYLSVKRLP